MGQDWLDPVVSNVQALKLEAAKRRKPHQEISVRKSAVDEYLDEGWHVSKELKTKTRMQRPWPHDVLLENRVWCLLQLLGYPEMSGGRNFKIRIERRGADPLYKQIDVFAKDDETAIVVECKSSVQPKRRSLQKDIEEFSSLKGPISSAIKAHYGEPPKLKIIWLFVTHNIIWSDPDKQRANGANIQWITERELRYFLEIAAHLRTAARFQFLAEFLKNQKIPEMEGVTVPAVKGKLGGRSFYSFVSTPRQMLKIAFVNHRSLSDPDGAPTYQRLVSRTRLNQIGKFLRGGGFFATNILVNFPQETRCRFDQIAKDPDTKVAFGHLYLPCRYRSAWIIDGQHRLYGYAPLSDEYLDQNIMIVAFEQLDPKQEADLFVDINHEQKRVSKTLLDDLKGDLKWGSEKPTERIGAIGARLIGLLNSDIGQPLYGRVTQQGIKATEETCLTVPELLNGLRRSGLIGRAIHKKKVYDPGPLCGATDTETLDRAATVLNAYFERLASANPHLWELGRPGYVCTNIGLQAHMRLLGSAIASMEVETRLDASQLEPLNLVAEIDKYLAPVSDWLQVASAVQMQQEFKVPFGSGGPTEYYFRLCRIVADSVPGFEPDGLHDWVEAQSKERIEEADRQLKEINIRVQKYIFDLLKREYGDAYWDKGVNNADIMSKAYKKSLDVDLGERLPLEHYLDFIEYKKIVENKDHWPMFRGVFDIPEPGEKGISKNIKWMERVNELRRISAHPTEGKNYKTEDFAYIRRIHAELTRAIAEADGSATMRML